MKFWTAFCEWQIFFYFFDCCIEVLVGLFVLFWESLEDVRFDGVKERELSAFGTGFTWNVGGKALNGERLFLFQRAWFEWSRLVK